jgi:heme/copper-type cytochrome/quinol oxidase subunit 4
LGSRRCSPSCRSFIAAPRWSGEPSIPVALVVLAIAQMGVHLVFFLHITTGPTNVNNVMALPSAC